MNHTYYMRLDNKNANDIYKFGKASKLATEHAHLYVCEFVYLLYHNINYVKF